ncbi:MAG TPA: cytochrome c biogenesis protein CcsA [Myxococcota bacterium]|jgi:heme exporter protein C|nr:cytochrome c biogenesis protein CcsA [Myxococcota bacterium]
MSDGGPDRLARRAVRPTGWALAILAPLWLFLVLSAPVDSVQGVVQKILYVHVPCAFATYAAFACTAVGGALYLWRRDEAWDRFAASAAEVGVLFCLLVIATGPIWARASWGRWWSWDLRLTLTLLLFLVYLSYLLLRSFTEGSERTARFAAVYGIAGLAIVPLNYLAIDLAGGRSIHPENLQRGSLGAGMRAPFWLGVLTGLVAFAHLLARRVELAALRERAAARDAAHGARAGEAPWAT